MELKYHDPIFITKLKHNKSNNSELFDKQLQTNKQTKKWCYSSFSTQNFSKLFWGHSISSCSSNLTPLPLIKRLTKKNTVQDETHSHINFLGNYTPSIDKAIFPVPLLESLYYDIGVIEYQIFQRS